MKHLLCLFFFIVVVSSVHTPEQLNKIRSLAKPCREEIGVSQETINKVINSGIIDDPKVSEFLVCHGKKLGTVTPDGELNTNFVLSRAKLVTDEEEAQRVVKKCVVKKDNIGQAILDSANCLEKNLPKISVIY